MKMKVVLMDNRISFNTFLRTDVLWSRFPKSPLINKAASSRLRFRDPLRFPKKKICFRKIHYRLGIKMSIKISENEFLISHWKSFNSFAQHFFPQNLMEMTLKKKIHFHLWRNLFENY